MRCGETHQAGLYLLESLELGHRHEHHHGLLPPRALHLGAGHWGGLEGGGEEGGGRLHPRGIRGQGGARAGGASPCPPCTTRRPPPGRIGWGAAPARRALTTNQDLFEEILTGFVLKKIGFVESGQGDRILVGPDCGRPARGTPHREVRWRRRPRPPPWRR